MSKLDLIRAACADGAKFHRDETTGRWIVLDQPGTALWTLSFSSIKNAAAAFFIVNKKRAKRRI